MAQHVLFESPDLAVHIAPCFFESVAFAEPRRLRACPLLGLTRAARALYRPLLDDYLVLHDDRLECRWRQGGWVVFASTFFHPGWQRISLSPHPEPWTRTLCERYASRAHDHLAILEGELQDRFLFGEEVLAMLDMATSLEDFCERYVRPTLRVLWNGSCA